jgi:zinc and cadmium transporter
MLAVRAGIWISTLTAVLIVSLISLVGTLVLVARETFLRRILHLLIGLAVGALLGDALIHILPELAEEGGLITGISLTVVGSILFFFLLEKFIHLHHQLRSPGQGHIKPVALNNLIGDGIHNFVDGAIIAGSFLVGRALGSRRRLRSCSTRSRKRLAISGCSCTPASLRAVRSSSTSLSR